MIAKIASVLDPQPEGGYTVTLPLLLNKTSGKVDVWAVAAGGSCRWGQPSRSRHTAGRALDGPPRLGHSDGVGLVLGSGLERQQPGEVLLDPCSVLACLLQKRERLIVVTPGCAPPDPLASYNVGRVDRGVNGKAGRSYRPRGFEFDRRSGQILLGFGEIGTHLAGVYGSRADLSGHYDVLAVVPRS